MVVDFVEGEDGGVEALDEVYDLHHHVEDPLLAVSLCLDRLGADMIELLPGEGILDLAHPRNPGGVEGHVHRVKADDFDARRGEIGKIWLDGKA